MSKNSENLGAGLVIVAILLSKGAYWMATTNEMRFFGPAHLCIGDTEVLALDSTGISVLDKQNGTSLGHQPWESMGLNPPFMDFQLLDNGAFLVAETQNKIVRRCKKKGQPCGTLANLSSLVGLFFKFHFDTETERLFVAGTHSNRIWSLQPPYEKENALVLTENVRAPNEVRLDSKGSLWVADTDGHRLMALDTETGDMRGKISARSGLTSKSFVLDFAGAGLGSWLHFTTVGQIVRAARSTSR